MGAERVNSIAFAHAACRGFVERSPSSRLASNAAELYPGLMPPRRKAGPAKKSATKKTAARPTAAKKRSKAVARATGRRGPRGLTAEHKAQLARGREEARIVRAYLDAIDAPRPRGRQRTPESIVKQISDVQQRLRSARGIEKLALLKKRRELEAARAKLSPRADLASLERDFVKVGRGYAERHGIPYSDFREVGVPAAVLIKARIPRTRLTSGRRVAPPR
jgi:hypothetical protein